MPHLPHGNRGKSGEQRIAVPTYHTAVSEDEVNMGIAECGTKDEVTAALRDQRLTDATPCDLENGKQEGVPFRHPVTVIIRGVCSTSDALIGLRSWNSMEVSKERSVLFSQDLRQVKEFIEFHRKSALNQVRRAHERMKEAEMAAYGPKSYFYCIKNGIRSVEEDA